MYSKVIPRLIFAVLWAVAIPVISEPIENANRLTLTVIYETYCPDSAKFITKQFYPWYITLDSKAVDVDMNPAGNTTLAPGNRSSEAFVCEHGPKECHANEIHACVLNAANLPIEKKLAFVNCTMAKVDLNGNISAYENTTIECTEAAGFNRSEIMSCTDSAQGSKVLKNYVDRIVTFRTAPIPSVLLNGEFNATFSKNAVEDIANAMCEWAKLKNATKEFCKPSGNSASTFGVTLPTIVITFLIVKLFQ